MRRATNIIVRTKFEPNACYRDHVSLFRSLNTLPDATDTYTKFNTESGVRIPAERTKHATKEDRVPRGEGCGDRLLIHSGAV